ncbi:hypothetical protein JCM5350_003880 [Sporobolomyces pararoseus]
MRREEVLKAQQLEFQRLQEQQRPTQNQNQIDLTGEEDSPPRLTPSERQPQIESKSLSTTTTTSSSSRSRLPPRYQQEPPPSAPAFPTHLQPSQVERVHAPSASSSSSSSTSTPSTAYLTAKGHYQTGLGPSTLQPPPPPSVSRHPSDHRFNQSKTFQSRNDNSNSNSSVYHKATVNVTYGPAPPVSRHAPAVIGGGGHHLHSQQLQRSHSSGGGGGSSFQPQQQQIPTGPRADRNQHQYHQSQPRLQRQKALDIDEKNNDPISSSEGTRYQDQYGSTATTTTNPKYQQQGPQVLERDHDKKFLHSSTSNNNNNNRRTSIQNLSSQQPPLRTITTPTETPSLSTPLPHSFDPNRSLWENQAPTSNDYQQPQYSYTLHPPTSSSSQAVASTSTSTSTARTRSPLVEKQILDQQEREEEYLEEDPEVQIMPPPAPVRIVPQDPSMRLGNPTITGHHQFSTPNHPHGGGGSSRNQRTSFRTSGGGGKVDRGFNDDEGDEPTSHQNGRNSRGYGVGGTSRGGGKGSSMVGAMKGRNQPAVSQTRLLTSAMSAATSTHNTAKSGKGSNSNSGNSRLSEMPKISKTGQKRIIHQDDPASQQEIAVQMVQKSIKNTNTHYRIGDPTPSTFSVKGVANQNGKITNRKGKGKEKVEEITVSSDDDEGEEEAQAEDSDPIEYSDDDLAQLQGGQPRAGPSKSTHSSMNHRKQVLSNERTGPSSDFDELGMELPGQFQRSGTRAGNVSSKVSHFEAISDGTAGGGGGGQKKLATSLGAKGAKKQPAPSFDGEANGEDAYDDRKAQITIAGASKKKKTKDGSPTLDPVIELAIRPYLLTKTAIPTNDDNVKFQLKLTPSKTTKPPKVTIVRKERNQESKEVASFGLDAVVRVEWMTLSQSRSDALAFTFKTSQSNQIFEQLCEGWITVQELENPRNEVLVISRGKPLDDPAKWKQNPSSAFEQILYCFSDYFSNDEHSFTGPSKKATVFEDCYSRAVEDWEKILGARARLENRETPTTSKSSRPRDKNASIQQPLSFSGSSRTIPQANFYGGAAGSSSTSAGDEMTIDQHGDWVVRQQQQQQQQPRRSARQSAANQRDISVQHRPPVKDPYPSDYVVLEYPMNSVGAGVTVTYGDRKRLNDDEFLNDTLIEFGLRKAMEGVKKKDETRADHEKVAPLTHVFNSFFYKKLSSGKQTKEAARDQRFAPYALVEKWTKKFDLFEKKYIVIPINEHLHWYLAVIVNPKWIIDNCPKECPLDEGYGRKEVPATRGRASMVLDSSSQPPTPTAESSQPPSGRKSKYFANKSEENNKEEEAGTPSEIEDEKELEHQEKEKLIQAEIQAQIASTEMGGEEGQEHDVDEDRDTVMADPNVEGGGNKDLQPGYIEIDDDDDDGQHIVPDSQQNGRTSTSVAPPSSEAPQPRKAVPILAPTAPPKGASSPPAPEVPLLRSNAAPEVINSKDEGAMDADEIAKLLGADPTLSNRCWIFTFDSLGGKHDAVVEKLKKYLDMEAKTKKGKEWTAANEVKGIAVRVPQQPNFCDCGLYILHFVEKFLANPLQMTEYIVARDFPHKTIKGNTEDVKRKREERKSRIRQYEIAMDREDFWKTEEAKNKRRTMRGELDKLIEEYKPIKLQKDAKEAEDKRAKDKKREEREKEKQKLEQAKRLEGGNENGGVESSAMERKDSSRSREGKEDKAAGETGGAKPKRGRGKGKKDPEVLYLESSDDEDGESAAGSPKKKSPRRPSPPASPPPAKQPPTVVASTTSSRTQSPPPPPTSANFIPEAAERSTTLRSLVSDDYGSDSEAMKSAEENLGDLDNSQTPQDPQSHSSKSHSHSKPTSTTSTASSSTERAQSPQEAQSPPRKKRKRLAQVPPKRPAPSPATELDNNNHKQVLDEEEEEGDQVDSDIEIRAPATPEFPPPNQQQLLADNASAISTTSSSSRKRGRKEVVNGDEKEEKNEPEMIEVE